MLAVAAARAAGPDALFWIASANPLQASKTLAALSISEHTAANHVRSILRKTGCANRTQATTYAHRHGLVES